MNEYTTNQPIGSTVSDHVLNGPSTGANPPLANPPTENMPPVLDEVPKCRDCNQPMISVGRTCLNCGDLLWQCPECKEVKLAYVRKSN